MDEGSHFLFYSYYCDFVYDYLLGNKLSVPCIVFHSIFTVKQYS